jgi:hypothetical protein
MLHHLHNGVMPGHPSKDQTGETDGVGSGVQGGCNNTAHLNPMVVSVVCTPGCGPKQQYFWQFSCGTDSTKASIQTS